MELRNNLQRHNLTYNSEENKYELPFNTEELKEYTFKDSNYFGKGKVIEDINDPLKANELVEKYYLMMDYKVDYNREIVKLLKKSISFGVVLSYLKARLEE